MAPPLSLPPFHQLMKTTIHGQVVNATALLQYAQPKMLTQLPIDCLTTRLRVFLAGNGWRAKKQKAVEEVNSQPIT